MYRNLYRSRIQVWTQSKTENAQRINIKFRKLYDTKARNNKSNQSTPRSDDNYGKTRLRQNLYGFKKENTQTYDRHKIKTASNTQISLKQNLKLQENERALEIKVLHNSKIKQEHT